MIREIPHWTIFELCKVHLDSGVTGFGETMVYYTWGASSITDEMIAKVVGRHPAEVMWDDSLGAGLQIALFDAAAKVLDVPLYQMLGKRHRDRCHVAWWDIDLPAADWISECRLAIEQGYTSFKTKGRPWWDLVENTRRLCATLPPHFEIDMDFNGFGVDTAHCTRLLKELEQFPNIVMYESPIPHHDIAGYKFLRQQTSVPISMHTATHFGDASLEMAIREEMCDGFVICGGASRIIRETHLCQGFNKSVFLQIVGSRIAANFALHLGAVLENARWPSVNCHQLYEHDCVTEPFIVSNGLAPVPEAPGQGSRSMRTPSTITASPQAQALFPAPACSSQSAGRRAPPPTTPTRSSTGTTGSADVSPSSPRGSISSRSPMTTPRSGRISTTGSRKPPSTPPNPLLENRPCADWFSCSGSGAEHVCGTRGGGVRRWCVRRRRGGGGNAVQVAWWW
ncbi:MAG: enolase C-terminal domain-like protein [Planctomycetales bacterium]